MIAVEGALSLMILTGFQLTGSMVVVGTRIYVNDTARIMLMIKSSWLHKVAKLPFW
jgi:hypothetical protein